MSERIWTLAQRQAIEADGGPLLVSAAAGSGKTAVLVERAARLLFRPDAPVDADRLLIVTYTKAAAGELRGRLAARLEQEISARPGDTALLRQRILLGRAPIGTVHSFCLSLLREFYGELGLPADFTTQDAAQLAALEEQALDEAMEASLLEDPGFAALAALPGRARSDEGVGRMIQRLVTLVRAMPYPEAQLTRLEEMYAAPLPPEDTPWGRELMGAVGRMADYGLSLTREGERLAMSEEAAAPYVAFARGEGEMFTALQGALGGSWDAARDVLTGGVFKRLSSPKVSPGLSEQFKTLRKIWKKVWENCQALMPCSAGEHAGDMAALAPLTACLIAAARRYMDALLRLKLEGKMLEFSDLEHMALALLSPDGTALTPQAREIRGRFDAIMVDEYQDTSELQDTLFRLLAAPGGENLFFVGDVKQSIYRFRQASPEGFLEKLRTFAPYGKGWPALVRLSENFRSLPGVLDGVNDVFRQLMSRNMGDVDYTEDEALRYGGLRDGLAGAFGFTLVEGTAEDEAAFVADEIARMLEQGETVGGKDGPRPCRPEDFAVLLRAPGTMGEMYRRALEARGIASLLSQDDNLLLAPAIQPVLAALRVVDNPAQDIPLAAAMLSPVFGFTPEDLTAIRAGHPGGGLWAAVAAGGEATAPFRQELATLRRLSAGMAADEFTRTLCRRTGYEEYCAVLPGTQDALAQLRAFYALAARYAGGGGLSGFLRMTDNAIAAGDDALVQGAAAPGRVAIMSIHRAKGLEYPICIVAGTGHRFNKIELKEKAQLHGALGIGLKLRAGTVVYDTLPWLAVSRRLHRENMGEEMRLLYVALTRARDRVLVTGATADAGRYLSELALKDVGELGPLPSLLEGRICPLDWLCLALLRHKGGEALRVRAASPLRPRPGDALVETRIVTPGPVAQTAPAPAAPPALPPADPALVAHLARGFAQAPPRQALARVPAKMAVTALAKEEESDLLPRPSFMYAAGLSAAERGTALHSFLQYADYAAARRSLTAEVERLVAGQYLRRDVADALPLGQIEQFLASPLCGEICAAGQVLREFAFITSIPAARVAPDLPRALAEESVLVQGIVDCLYIQGDAATLVDYKSDRVRTPEELAQRYRAQLTIYRDALAPRLGVPISRCVLYSFHLGVPVEV